MHINKLKWITTKKISVGKHLIPCTHELKSKINQKVGLKKDTKTKLISRAIFRPFRKIRDDLLVDGFIERILGKWIKELVKDDSVFLEIGCGDMSLRRFLPQHICYNAFDISFSEFHIRRILKSSTGNYNLALASATNIPLESNCVSLIVSAEVLPNIPEINKVISEIHRVAMPKAKLLCSIANTTCYKYCIKGTHREHIHKWSYVDFKELMEQHRFKFLKGLKMGYWIPLPLWIKRTSYQLPIMSKNEFYNTNFFYMFEIDK